MSILEAQILDEQINSEPKKSIGNAGSKVIKAVADQIEQHGLNHNMRVESIGQQSKAGNKTLENAIQGNGLEYKGTECLTIENKLINLTPGNTLLHCEACPLAAAGTHRIEGAEGCPIQDAITIRNQDFNYLNSDSLITPHIIEYFFRKDIHLLPIARVLNNMGKRSFSHDDQVFYEYTEMATLIYESGNGLEENLVGSLEQDEAILDSTHYSFGATPATMNQHPNLEIKFFKVS